MPARPLLTLTLLLAACAADKPTGDTDTAPPTQTLPDRDGDGAPDGSDCAPDDAAVFPGAAESCDGVDQDCDGLIDEAGGGAWYADVDGDGWGDPGLELAACDPPAGYVADRSDCDDGDPAVNPAAQEVCGGGDEDCDGLDDLNDPSNDPATALTLYADRDGDGWGDPLALVITCGAEAGAVADGTDCDDAVAAANPGAAEVCDGIDNDCDALTDADDDSLTDPLTFWTDADGDSFGDPDRPVNACAQPPGTSINYGDCDDADPLNNPAAPEYCDGLDTDCDGGVDDNALDAFDVWEDKDGDGYGDPLAARRACTQPADTALNDLDCDDNDAAICPAAPEVCGDGTDQDCDGADC